MSAIDDWQTVLTLFENQRYVHSLFFAHLSMEKLLKANWVRCQLENIPPKTHNLVKLLYDTDFDLIHEDINFMQAFNDFQLEGRYPDHLFKLNKLCDLEYTSNILNKVEKIRIWLLQKV
ncbi:MAG: HEPN domain-containing protein [Saprospiraceae bacterium]|nr:HEPN domain-containing protein [Saprospiraceae bacterium]